MMNGDDINALMNIYMPILLGEQAEQCSAPIAAAIPRRKQTTLPS